MSQTDLVRYGRDVTAVMFVHPTEHERNKKKKRNAIFAGGKTIDSLGSVLLDGLLNNSDRALVRNFHSLRMLPLPTPPTPFSSISWRYPCKCPFSQQASSKKTVRGNNNNNNDDDEENGSRVTWPNAMSAAVKETIILAERERSHHFSIEVHLKSRTSQCLRLALINGRVNLHAINRISLHGARANLWCCCCPGNCLLFVDSRRRMSFRDGGFRTSCFERPEINMTCRFADECVRETEFVCRWFIPVLSVSCHLSIAPSENLAHVGTDFSRVLFWVKTTS
ncbi:hypothetical protein CEXT_586591 [Caerostris extrusa]|uniref:Uncharacterized protein n=1 Tax=Caerostris extrusa TaxID=172846 RepID=A0AAV4RD12_CAEEX|nr:hypothetical protein CEXT_586591 [Caerostris extrusa]